MVEYAAFGRIVCRSLSCLSSSVPHVPEKKEKQGSKPASRSRSLGREAVRAEGGFRGRGVAESATTRIVWGCWCWARVLRCAGLRGLSR